jgi:long-chain acyl-CoA synthetase
MDKVWLKSYPQGVPAEIDPSEYDSLRDLFEEACGSFAAAPAYTNMGTTLSFAGLDEQSRAFGAWLQKSAGLAKGDRVALMMPNILQYPVALFGVLRAGLVAVNTNPLYTPRELKHQLKDSGAVAIVIVENFAHVLAEVLTRTSVRTVVVTAVGDMLDFPRGLLVNFVLRHVRKQVPPWHMPQAVPWRKVLRAGRGLALERPALGHTDIAFLQYTGGTTGVAKGAVLTHRNMVANVLQSSAWIAPVLGAEGDKTIITALPLYHIFSLTANGMLFMRLGARNVLITNPRDFKGFIAELKKHSFYYISGVNTLFNALLHTPGFESVNFESLRVSLGGGMAVQRAVAERWEQVTGCKLTQAWGLTETSPAACINPTGIDFNGSIGLPISSTEISIRNEAGDDLGLNQVGEICVRARRSWRAIGIAPRRRPK